jgi:N-acetylneuraminic acid mutarotase
MPTPKCDFDMVVVGKYLYVVGGRSGPDGQVQRLRTLERYDPAADTWAVMAPMPTGRNSFATAVLDGRIYAMGGDDGPPNGGHLVKTVEVYDPPANRWSRAADLPLALAAINAAAVNDAIYVFGDYPGSRGQVFRYTPATDSWDVIQPPSAPRLAHPAVVTVGQKAYVFGGEIQGTFSAAAFEFDLVSRTYIRGPDMRFPRVGFAWAAVDNTLYAFGGVTAPGVMAASNTMERLALRGGQAVPNPRAVFRLHDGTILTGILTGYEKGAFLILVDGKVDRVPINELAGILFEKGPGQNTEPKRE